MQVPHPADLPRDRVPSIVGAVVVVVRSHSHLPAGIAEVLKGDVDHHHIPATWGQWSHSSQSM